MKKQTNKIKENQRKTSLLLNLKEPVQMAMLYLKKKCDGIFNFPVLDDLFIEYVST